LDGLDRLTREGRFTEPQSSTDSILALQDLVSPKAAFVRDECDVGSYEVWVPAVYEAWKEWAELNGHKPGSVQSFGRDLRAVVPTLRQVQHRDGTSRERYYVGMRLKPHSQGPRVPPRDSTEDEEEARAGTRTPVMRELLGPEGVNGVATCKAEGCTVALDTPESEAAGLCATHQGRPWVRMKDGSVS
jgi:phage/plasmid-associated DNA primase